MSACYHWKISGLVMNWKAWSSCLCKNSEGAVFPVLVEVTHPSLFPSLTLNADAIKITVRVWRLDLAEMPRSCFHVPVISTPSSTFRVIR